MLRILSKSHRSYRRWFSHACWVCKDEFKHAYKKFKEDFGFVTACALLAGACSYFPYYVYNNAHQFGPPQMAFSGRLPADLETSTEDAQTRLSATRFRLLRAEVNGSGPTIVPEEILDAIATASISLDTSTDPITTASIDPVTTGSIRPRRRASSRLENQSVRNIPDQKPNSVNASSGNANTGNANTGNANTGNASTGKAKTGKVSVPKLNFQLIFASAGHALIQDGVDIVPVSRGSRLPDGSTVRSVRKRQGQWQLVTSNNAILTMKQ